MSIRAFILAGGLGTRLRSVVSDRPKPMAPVHGKPFLEILVQNLYGKGTDEVVLLTGYQSEWIEAHFRSWTKPRVWVSREDIPLGTGGAVKYAEHFATDPTLLVNGDTFFDVDMAALISQHREKGLAATLSLTEVPDASRYGSVLVDGNGLVVRFEEKARVEGPGLINAGVTLLSLEAIRNLPSDRAFSMENEVFPSLAAQGQMAGCVQKGAFFDIGTPESYRQFLDYARDHLLATPARD
ncbi:MAG: nucleotidyltransferase family protein [Desulfomonilaceae bacterium]